MQQILKRVGFHLAGWLLGFVVIGLVTLTSLLGYWIPPGVAIALSLFVAVGLGFLSKRFRFWVGWAGVCGAMGSFLFGLSLPDRIALEKYADHPPITIAELGLELSDGIFWLEGVRPLQQEGSADYCTPRRYVEGNPIHNCYRIGVQPLVSVSDDSEKPRIVAWIQTRHKTHKNVDGLAFSRLEYSSRERLVALEEARNSACEQHQLCAPNAPILRSVQVFGSHWDSLEMSCTVYSVLTLLGFLCFACNRGYVWIRSLFGR